MALKTSSSERQAIMNKTGCSAEELRALYLLNNMRGMLSDKLLRIYEYFGSYQEAYSADIHEYIEAGLIVKDSTKDAFAELKAREAMLLRRAEGFADKGIRLVSMFDPEYPKRLDNIKNKPPLLYVSGKLPDDNRHAAAIVGSRKCSEYGSTVAELFAAELAANGVQIVSGLAYGIDGAAARGSLRAADESYGVLGCGINICYPKYNGALYDRMRHGAGGIISELPLDTPAQGYNFVLRNRIISGLSDVLIVIEAGHKSGTSITVGYALDQGKEVYALPGRIDDPLGYGCNQFIKEGANIITEAADILRFFELQDEHCTANKDNIDETECNDVCATESSREAQRKALRESQGEAKRQLPQKAKESFDKRKTIKTDQNCTIKQYAGLDHIERQVYESLLLEPQHVEHIAYRAKLDVADAVTALMMLEAKGLIRSPRYAYYQRLK